MRLFGYEAEDYKKAHLTSIMLQMWDELLWEKDQNQFWEDAMTERGSRELHGLSARETEEKWKPILLKKLSPGEDTGEKPYQVVLSSTELPCSDVLLPSIFQKQNLLGREIDFVSKYFAFKVIHTPQENLSLYWGRSAIPTGVRPVKLGIPKLILSWNGTPLFWTLQHGAIPEMKKLPAEEARKIAIDIFDALLHRASR